MRSRTQSPDRVFYPTFAPHACNSTEFELTNPYSASTADLTKVAPDDATYLPRMWSIQGRIGRVRYLAYVMTMTLVIYLVAGLIIGGLHTINPAVAMLGATAVLPALAVSFITSIRRLNDLNQSGWLSILTIIPMVNMFIMLWLLFAKGTAGANDYGPAPAPNTRTDVLLARIAPVVLIAGSFTFMAKFGNFPGMAPPTFESGDDTRV